MNSVTISSAIYTFSDSFIQHLKNYVGKEQDMGKEKNY